MTYEDKPNLLAPASRPDVPSTGRAIRSNRKVRPVCGAVFEAQENFFKCVLPPGHEHHGKWIEREEDAYDGQCGLGDRCCGKARGHDRHQHSIKEPDPTLADIGYTSTGPRAMRGEPENLDHQDQARISERGEMYDAQRKLARTADRAPDRELLADEARVVDAKRRARMTHLGPALAPEFRLMEHLLGSQKPADQRRGKTKLRKVEQRLDEAA